jgi:hypothetical protein
MVSWRDNLYLSPPRLYIANISKDTIPSPQSFVSSALPLIGRPRSASTCDSATESSTSTDYEGITNTFTRPPWHIRFTSQVSTPSKSTIFLRCYRHSEDLTELKSQTQVSLDPRKAIRRIRLEPDPRTNYTTVRIVDVLGLARR